MHQDRVHQRAVGNIDDAVLDALVQAIVEAFDFRPGRATIGRAEQSDGGGTGIPHVRLGHVSGRQPEHAVDGAALLA
jgi:hypothetical protein